MVVLTQIFLRVVLGFLVEGHKYKINVTSFGIIIHVVRGAIEVKFKCVC